MRPALIIFAKMPVPGKVKTRLASLLSLEQAAELYRCMLHDTLEKAKKISGAPSIFLFYEPGAAAAAYFEEKSQGLKIHPQEGQDLGERMGQAFTQVFSAGHKIAAIIGTDSPHIPKSYICEAFARLELPTVDMVMGPAVDGGYYLLGMKRLHPYLFKGIAWSSASVCKESIEKAKKAGLSVALLPEWHDVDTADDLLRPELLDEGNGAALTRDFIRKRVGCAAKVD